MRTFARSIRIFVTELVPKAVLKRPAILYATTFVVMPPLDLRFPGIAVTAMGVTSGLLIANWLVPKV